MARSRLQVAMAGWLLLMGVMLVTPDVLQGRGDPDVRLFYLDPWPKEPDAPSTETAMQPTAPGMETAVGGVCPPNVCENGDMSLELACDHREMGLRVLKAAIAHLSLNVSSLHTSNGKCRAVESSLHVSITLTHENHTQCGTEVKVNGTHLIYSNELSTGFPSPGTPRNSISRSADVRMAFSCVYHYDRVVSLPYPLITSASLVTFVVKEGEFLVRMTLHPSADFQDPYHRPPIIPLTDRLYVQLQILRYDPQDFFTLGLEECWATPGQNHANEIRHLIISSGLASDVTAAILESGNRSLSRFSLQMFHFVKFPEFYLHCRVWLYQANASRCCNPPTTSNGRHIRDLSDPYRKVVSCGPIRLRRSSVSGIGKPKSGLSPFILPASSAAALTLLLLGLVTMAKVLRKRAKRRGRVLPGPFPRPVPSLARSLPSPDPYTPINKMNYY